MPALLGWLPPSHYSFLQVAEDLENGIPGAVPIPPDDAGKNDVIAALVANVEAMIKADRKITSLKQLQVSEESTFKSYFPFLGPSFFAHSIIIYKTKFWMIVVYLVIILLWRVISGIPDSKITS